MKTLLPLIAASLLFCGQALAQDSPSNPWSVTSQYRLYTTERDVTVAGTLLQGLPGNVARTFDDIPVVGLNSVTFFIRLADDATASVTGATMACQSQPTRRTYWYDLQSCSGTICASNDAAWSKTYTATASTAKGWPWTVTFPPSARLRCTLTPTGAAAADLLSVESVGGVQ